MGIFGNLFEKGENKDGQRSYPLDQGLTAFFTQDHRNCDMNWGDLESSLGKGNDEDIHEKWRLFNDSMRRHFDMEEKELFPLFERATGMTGGGPTFVMRMEHSQMKGVLDDMALLMEEKNYEEIRNQGDTLLMLIQQHNVKEEGMLYPMSEQHLASEWSALSTTLKGYINQA